MPLVFPNAGSSGPYKPPSSRFGKFIGGFLSTLDPWSYATLPQDLNTARKHPLAAADAALMSLFTPEGLGSLTSSAALGGAGMAAKASKLGKVTPEPRAPKDMIAEAIAREKAIRGQQQMAMIQNHAPKMPILNQEQTLRNATRRLGFFRPDDPRNQGKALGKNEKGNPLDSRPISKRRATEAMNNPNGFFFGHSLDKKVGDDYGPDRMPDIEDDFENAYPDDFRPEFMDDPEQDLAMLNPRSPTAPGPKADMGSRADQWHAQGQYIKKFFEDAFGSKIVNPYHKKDIGDNQPELQMILNDTMADSRGGSGPGILNKASSIPDILSGKRGKFLPYNTKSTGARKPLTDDQKWDLDVGRWNAKWDQTHARDTQLQDVLADMGIGIGPKYPGRFHSPSTAGPELRGLFGVPDYQSGGLDTPFRIGLRGFEAWPDAPVVGRSPVTPGVMGPMRPGGGKQFIQSRLSPGGGKFYPAPKRDPRRFG